MSKGGRMRCVALLVVSLGLVSSVRAEESLEALFFQVVNAREQWAAQRYDQLGGVSPRTLHSEMSDRLQETDDYESTLSMFMQYFDDPSPMVRSQEIYYANTVVGLASKRMRDTPLNGILFNRLMELPISEPDEMTRRNTVAGISNGTPEANERLKEYIVMYGDRVSTKPRFAGTADQSAAYAVRGIGYPFGNEQSQNDMVVYLLDFLDAELVKQGRRKPNLAWYVLQRILRL